MSDGEGWVTRTARSASSPMGASYRGKAGCRNIMCSRNGNPDSCYGWHCLYCDGPSNCQGDCSNKACPHKVGVGP